MTAFASTATVDSLCDTDLVAAIRQGDDAAFEEVFRRYSDRIRAYVYGMVRDHGRAEDVTQEVFLSALRRLRVTDSPITLRPWLYEIAKNASIDVFRRTSRAEEVPIDSGDALRPTDHLRLVGNGDRPESAAIGKERLDHLRGAFDELSESHHRILVLRELEGLSYREIGERMELTRPAVESTLFRARRRLQREYEDLDTGVRCDAVTAVIARLAEGIDSGRERSRVRRHVRRCPACRRRARELGVSIDRRPIRTKVAALLPLPVLLRRRRADTGADSASTSVHTGTASLQHVAGTWVPTVAGPGADATASTFGKAAALVLTVAIGASGAVAVHHRFSPVTSLRDRDAAADKDPRERREARPAPLSPLTTQGRGPAAPKATAPARKPADSKRPQRRSGGGGTLAPAVPPLGGEPGPGSGGLQTPLIEPAAPPLTEQTEPPPQTEGDGLPSLGAPAPPPEEDRQNRAQEPSGGPGEPSEPSEPIMRVSSTLPPNQEG
jgi:RNA polymerase sigma factor (sigma-70 family)